MTIKDDSCGFSAYNSEFVRMKQDISIADFKYEEPTINWSALGSQPIKRAKKFAEDLLEIIELAKSREKYIGKTYKDNLSMES